MNVNQLLRKMCLPKCCYFVSNSRSDNLQTVSGVWTINRGFIIETEIVEQGRYNTTYIHTITFPDDVKACKVLKETSTSSGTYHSLSIRTNKKFSILSETYQDTQILIEEIL